MVCTQAPRAAAAPDDVEPATYELVLDDEDDDEYAYGVDDDGDDDDDDDFGFDFGDDDEEDVDELFDDEEE